jgi:hypothetical protein
MPVLGAIYGRDGMTDAELFKDVESLCGVCRLSIREAFTKTSVIIDPQFREDAMETLQGTLHDIVALYRGENEDQPLLERTTD